MKYKAVIIEDERKSMEIIKNKLHRYCENIKIIGTQEDPELGIDLISKCQPDIVFLDIAMPKYSGFDVLDKIENPDFEIIFVTAFGEYAIQAIKYCAIGYLVKPFKNEDLIVAVKNAINNINLKNSLDKNNQLKRNNKQDIIQMKKIHLPTYDGYEFIEMRQIIRIEGFDGYSKIYLQNNTTIVSSKNLGVFEHLLENSDFFRVHRSHIINTNFIKFVDKQGFVILEDKTEINISRRRKSAFLESLNSN